MKGNIMNQTHITFFDTTCRDGKQAPGNNHSPFDTLRIARQLATLGVSVCEAGFAASSEADFESVQLVAAGVPELVCCSFARALPQDIDAAAQALSRARSPRIHTFIATSDLHLEHKYGISRDTALERAARAVALSYERCGDAQFSAEDATRSDFAFLKSMVREVILAGARTVNLPDTVGYALPHEIATMFTRVLAEVPEVTEYGVTLAVHCHNDLGLATANTLAGIKAGARQVECTVSGIGERAGNTHYAEVVGTLSTRAEQFGITHSIQAHEIGRTAQLVSEIIRKPIPDTLPLVGRNVFAHGAGIHQHGMQKHPLMYQIMSPESVGWNAEQFPLSAQSGRHGLKYRLAVLGYPVAGNELGDIYQRFLKVATKKVLVHDNDLHLLMQSGEE
jgi:2-isopropylmalate synthase